MIVENSKCTPVETLNEEHEASNRRINCIPALTFEAFILHRGTYNYHITNGKYSTHK
jgi:hypothetical protein